MTNISQTQTYPPEVQTLFSVYKSSPNPDSLAALRDCLIENLYSSFLQTAQGALRSKGIKDPEAPTEMIHQMLFDELERLVDACDSQKSLPDFLKGCIYRDYTFGRPYWLRKQGNVELSLELEILEQGDLPEPSIPNPEERFFAEDELELDLSQLDLAKELPKVIETWVQEDEQNPNSQNARHIVYTGIMSKVLEILRAEQDPFTPTGRLRLGKETLRELEASAGRSDRTVRSYVRALEPRIEGLKRSR